MRKCVGANKQHFDASSNHLSIKGIDRFNFMSVELFEIVTCDIFTSCLFISTGPPSKPQNVTVNFVDQSTVMLAWLPPLSDGGRTDTRYRVICDACGSQVNYNPPLLVDVRVLKTSTVPFLSNSNFSVLVLQYSTSKQCITFTLFCD